MDPMENGQIERRKSTPIASEPVARVLLALALSGVLLLVLRALSPILVPFLQAAFIGVIASQPLSWMRRRGVPRLPAVLTVILAVTAGLGLITTVIVLSLADMRSRFPVYQARLNGIIQDIVEPLNRFQVDVPTQGIEQMLDPSALLGFMAQAAQEVGGTIAQGFFVMLLVFFALMEIDRQPAKLRALSSRSKSYLVRFEQFAKEINQYLIIKTWISVATGFTAGMVLVLLGVEHAVLWGVITFALNYIPTVGSVVAAIPPASLALLDQGWLEALLVVGVYIVINVVFANLLEPRFMSEGLGMSPVVILVSLASWGWVFGITGVFLAVPLAMMLRAILESSPDTKWVAVLLGLRRSQLEPTATVRESAPNTA